MWCEGWPSRLALGTMWLAAIGVSGYGRGLIPAIPLAAIAAALGGVCGGHVAAAGINGASWWRFVCTWSALLGRLGALAGAARALAATIDALAGGRAHRWLFGAPPLPPAAEPWPDPLAVAALALLCLMFMCGLENSSMLTFVLFSSVISGVLFFISTGSIGANFANWEEQYYFPEGLNGMILAAGCCMYAFPEALPLMETTTKKIACLGIIMLPVICMMGIAITYSLIGSYREYCDSVVPLVQLFETHQPAWARPVMASFTVVALALAMTEVLPQAVSTLVTMAGPEWKVLTRVLTYESTTTGSQVLAVFSAGSLSAILAFACPLSHLVKLTCAGQVLVWVLEAGILLHLRCQPDQQVEDPTDVRYKRLAGTQPRPLTTRPTRGARLAAGLWFLPRSVRQAAPPDPQKLHKNIGEERECLLLDEYGVARTGTEESDHSEQSDVSEHRGGSSSDGESSTDIDAVVKEYKDRITVVSSVPDSSSSPGIPNAASGKRATAGAFIVILGSFLAAIGIALSLPIMIYVTTPLVFCGGLLCWWQPAKPSSVGVLTCTSCAFICSILATPLLADAWPAFVLFTIAGYVMYARRTAICGSSMRRHSRRAPPLLGPRPARITHLDTVYIAR